MKITVIFLVLSSHLIALSLAAPVSSLLDGITGVVPLGGAVSPGNVVYSGGAVYPGDVAPPGGVANPNGYTFVQPQSPTYVEKDNKGLFSSILKTFGDKGLFSSP